MTLELDPCKKFLLKVFKDFKLFLLNFSEIDLLCKIISLVKDRLISRDTLRFQVEMLSM